MSAREQDSFGVDLAHATNASSVHERAVEEVQRRIAVDGINLTPIAPTAGGVMSSVMYLRGGDARSLYAPTARAVQALQREPDLLPLFEQPRCAMHVERSFGWERWLRSATYQEHFRYLCGARQFVLGITDSLRRPYGFLAVTRAEAEAPFTAEDEEKALALRDSLERALHAFELVSDWSQSTAATLESITQALPVPALLFDGARVLWMNLEAELRLGVLALALGGSEFHIAGSLALEELLVYARRELQSPGATLTSPALPGQYGWLLPGESVVVRRIEHGGMASCALVCLCAAPVHALSVDRTTGHGLTEREASVAVLAAKGHSVLGIAANLNIAENTVCTHMKRVYRKLGVRSRAELAWKLRGKTPY